MFRSKSVFVCAAVVLTVFIASSVVAQPSRYMLSYEIHVKPGEVDEWEAGIKKIIEASNKEAIPQNWSVYQAVNGYRGNTYWINLNFTKWENRGRWADMRAVTDKVYGKEESARLWDVPGRVEETRSTVWAILDDATANVSPDATPSRFYDAIVYDTKPEMASVFRSLLVQAKAANEASPRKRTAYRFEAQYGEGFRFLTSRPFDDWSHLDKPQDTQDLQEYLGEQGWQAWMRAFEASIIKRDHIIVAYRPDLSRPPTPTSN